MRFGKVVEMGKGLLREGLAPEQLALTICLGSAAGIFPLLWGTTLLCACLAALFRLNQAAMQAVNYLVYPLQMALFVPFFRLGDRWLPWGPPVSTQLLKQALHGHVSVAFAAIGWATAKAACAWLVTVPPSELLLYPVLKAVLKKRVRRAAPDTVR